MKNTINHLIAERAKRPREQHLSLDTRKVEEIIKGVNDQVSQINKLTADLASAKNEIENQRQEINSLKIKLARKVNEEAAAEAACV